jgi:hypothetical protein
MYDKIFAISQVSNNQNKHDFQLKNYSYLGGELEEDFYYRSFLKTLLFKIDVLALEDFLDYQFENSKDDIKFLKVLELKVIPDISKIYKNAEVTGIPLVYRDEKPLAEGFVETQGVIKHPSYDFSAFYHITASRKLSEDLIKKNTEIERWLKNTKELGKIDVSKKLKWIGKPTHLAVIIRELVDRGYIELPLKASGDPAPTELSRQIVNSFKILKECKLETLVNHSSPDNTKYEPVKEKFVKYGFEIPNSKLLG